MWASFFRRTSFSALSAAYTSPSSRNSSGCNPLVSVLASATLDEVPSPPSPLRRVSRCCPPLRSAVYHPAKSPSRLVLARAPATPGGRVRERGSDVRGRRVVVERRSIPPAPSVHSIIASPHLAAAIDKTPLRVRVRPSQSAITPPPRDTTPILALSAVANRLERPSAARARRPRRGRRTATTRRASSVASRQPLFVPFVSPRMLAFDRA